MVSRRRFIGLTGAAGAVGVAGAAGVDLSRASASTSLLVGSTNTGTDAVTGRTDRVVRMYHRQGTPIPTSAAAAKILTPLQQGRQVVYSIKVPDASATTAAACAALAADIEARGYSGQTWIAFWHEPYPDMSAAEYIARFRASAPGVRQHHIRTGVIWQMYPILHKGVDYTTYWPGDSISDFVGIDTYPGDDRRGLAADPLATISPLTRFAKSRGKVFGVAEFGVNSRDAVADPGGAAAWLERFENLGSSCRFLTYFDTLNGGDFRLSANNGLLVPAYRHLYDHFA